MCSKFLEGFRPPQTFLKKTKETQQLILDSITALEDFGIPMKEKSGRLQEKIALAFLSLSDMKKGKKWSQAKDINDIQRTTREIISHQNETYGEDRSSGSYDDVRREDMKEIVLGEIVLRTKPDAATNDPTRKYGLSAEYVEVMKSFGTSKWKNKLKELISNKGKLSKIMQGNRQLKQVPVQLSADEKVILSSGVHNELY